MIRFYIIVLLAIVTSCDMNQMDMNAMSMSGQNNNKKYSTNGETIFRTGRNLSGQLMQDLEKSQMSMMVHSCVSCHGSEGKGLMNTPSITYKVLTDPTRHDIPYTDYLILQFLD